MKGLIPAAGTGDRFKPITLAIPKELLVIGQKACIEHVVDAFILADVTDITIIVGWKKHAILDYFGSGKRLGVDITYLVQDNREGLAKAVEVGKKAMGDELLRKDVMKFALFLGCTIPSRLKGYEYSSRAVLEALGVELVDVVDFSCCGYPLRNIDFKAFVLSSARNLALAEREGLNMVVLCKCGFGSLKKAARIVAESAC